MAEKKVKRVLVVEGSSEWVRLILEKSWVKPGEPAVTPRGMITEIERTELEEDEGNGIQNKTETGE